jgi:predicted acetyltransferase
MTTAPAGYRLTEITEDRLAEFRDVDGLAFAEGERDAATDAAAPFAVPLDRALGVDTDAGELVAVHGSYAFRLPVPGGEVPCAGLTWVGVRPDHRRRRLLSTMMRAHVERSLGRGEPVSALFAAEPGIYGRFGYGSASDHLRLTVPRGAALRDVPGAADLTVRFVTLDPAAHEKVVDAVHAAAGEGRPGWLARDTDALRRLAVADPPAWRRGGEQARLVTVHDTAGEPRAYALVRRTQTWADGGPEYPVQVRSSAAVDAAAAHRLWSFLLDLDLTATVTTGILAVDDPLLSLLVDVRKPVPKVSDNLWLRLLDVPAALAARRYAAPVDVVLGVWDALLPGNAGAWRLTTGDAGAGGTYTAQVRSVTDAPDIELDVRELGAAYLGGRSLTALAGAGLVTGRAEVLHRASTAFGWPVAPVCPWVF